jgi:hypothetical protein
MVVPIVLGAFGGRDIDGNGTFVDTAERPWTADAARPAHAAAAAGSFHCG